MDAIEISSIKLVAPVTALHIEDSVILCGQGNIIDIYDYKTQRSIESTEIFKSSVVHGIRPAFTHQNVLYLCIFGSKSLKLLSLDTELKCSRQVTKEVELEDWIWDVSWLPGDSPKEVDTSTLAVVLGHNSVLMYDWQKDCILKHVHCQEKCLLYCGRLLGRRWEDLVLAAGTVFNQVVLWGVAGKTNASDRVVPFTRLEGHQGVIFNIAFRYSLLASVSDDRSVRLWRVSVAGGDWPWSLPQWESATYEEILVLYGHAARVWDALLLREYIVSVGEDATCVVWNYSGKIVAKYKGHKGKSILSLAASGDESILVTGGGDTSIRMWHLSESQNRDTRVKHTRLNPTFSKEEDYVRTVRLGNKDCVLALSNEGELLCYKLSCGIWEHLLTSDRYRSYGVLEPQPGGALIALGNIHGQLWIRDLQTGVDCEQQVHEGKVHSIQWLVDKQGRPAILSTGPLGLLEMWLVDCTSGSPSLCHLCTLQLPHTKQWWVSAATLVTEEGTTDSDENLLICGDRGGTLHVFSISQQRRDPLQSFPRIHGKTGVTCVCYHGNRLYSGGRDGHYHTFRVKQNRVELLSSHRVAKGFDWITRMVFIDGDLMILGFHTDQFVMHSVARNQRVFSVRCGGGHRAWDFLYSAGWGNFTYIKQNNLVITQSEIQTNQLIIQPNMHGRETTDVKCLFTQTSANHRETTHTLATSGEDTFIKLIKLTEDATGTTHRSVGHIQGHLSSVRCLAVSPSQQPGNKVLFSGGGRAQLKAWRVAEPARTGSAPDSSSHLDTAVYEALGAHNLCEKSARKRKPYDQSPETRYMALAAYSLESTHSSGQHGLACACSDGLLRLFIFDEENRQFELVAESAQHDHCMLTVCNLHVPFMGGQTGYTHILLTGATDGQVLAWDVTSVFQGHARRSSQARATASNKCISGQTNSIPSELCPIYAMSAHQSGVNALDATHISDDRYIIASGGDDGAINVAMVSIRAGHPAEFILVACWTENAAHAAQVTGLSLLGPYGLVSSSIDQRLSVWNVKLTQESVGLSLCCNKFVHVADPGGMATWRGGLGWKVVLVGIGLQAFTLRQRNPDQAKEIKGITHLVSP